MRRSGERFSRAALHTGMAPEPPRTHTDWVTLKRLIPYLWDYKWRVMAALAFMIAAKLANVGVPLLLKQLVDAMSPTGGRAAGFQPGEVATAVFAVPVGLLVAYGLLRLSTTLFTELRELVF